MRTVTKVGDLMQRTGMITHVGYLVAGRSRGRVTPCAVYTWHVETRSAVSWLSLKIKLDGLSVVWPQNQSDGFRRFSLKTDDGGF
jgi:hypothetical protein